MLITVVLQPASDVRVVGVRRIDGITNQRMLLLIGLPEVSCKGIRESLPCKSWQVLKDRKVDSCQSCVSVGEVMWK